jgi:hypothetical protein
MRSLTRAVLGTALAAVALGGFAGAADAANLFTTSSGATLVTVGSTLTVTTSDFRIQRSVGETRCAASLNGTVEVNGSGTVHVRFTSSTFSGCTLNGNAVSVTGSHGSGKFVLSTSALTNRFNGEVQSVDLTISGAGTSRCVGTAVDSYIDPTGTGYVYWDNNGANPALVDFQTAGPLTNSTGGTCTMTGDLTVQSAAAAFTMFA